MMIKRPVKKRQDPLLSGSGGPNPPVKPYDLLNGAPSLYRGMHIPNAVQSK